MYFLLCIRLLLLEASGYFQLSFGMRLLDRPRFHRVEALRAVEKGNWRK
jgi:hypothetical protein